MEIWVLFAVAAAATQALRTAVQRRMVAPLGSYGAAYIRFSYACPIAWLCVVVYTGISGATLAGLPFAFWAWINIAALTQDRASWPDRPPQPGNLLRNAA